jgi:hypothetical protein
VLAVASPPDGARDVSGSVHALLTAVRGGTGRPDVDPATVQVLGETGLGGPFPVSGLALGSVAAQLLAANELTGACGGVHLDARHVGVAFRSERFVRLEGRSVGLGFAPLSRFWRTADGWLRLHGNYPHHRDAVLGVLGEDVERAAATWRAEDLEAAVVDAGGAAAAVRTPEQWRAHPQGIAAAELPLLSLRRSVDGPLRRRELRGLRVLDLTRVIAGPVATRTLASHGADVLRIDGPRIPEDPDALLDTGSGKRHVTMDFTTPGGRRTVDALLSGADVVVQGYRPGALDAFGLAPEALAERHPHLVVVRLSAWGSTGPWRGRRGFDSLVQAATGIALRAGSAQAPGTLPVQALDHATGHLAAAVVLGALARQREEGGGWYGELSLAQTAHWLLAAPAEPRDDGVEVDATPYLQELPSARGTVGVVAPPGSPPWTAAADLSPTAAPQWRS